MNYEFDRTTMVDNNTVVNTVEYEPNGTDHRLQRRITELMDRLVQNDGRVTLSELGYLHMNTLMYNRDSGRISLKVYFDVHYAARVKKDKTNTKKVICPVDELKIFENYMYVGELPRAVTYETIMAPKTKMVEDEKKRPSIRFKDDAKFVETEVLVLNCNLPITMAAMHDLNLTDPSFKVRCVSVGRGDADKTKTIIANGRRKEVPVKVIVTAGQLVDEDGEPLGFDPADCNTYLKMLQEKNLAAAANREKAADKARDKADKKKNETIGFKKGFNKYS